MTGFRIRAQTLNEMLPGRWLCLDALLDVALEIAGVPEADRRLPLSVWDGATLHPAGQVSPARVREEGMVHAGSAALFDAPVRRERGFISTHRQIAFDPELPYTDRRGKSANKIETNKTETKSVMNARGSFLPLMIEWRGHGDPEQALDLLMQLLGIGAKTAHGFGAFEIDPYHDLSEDPAPLCGITDGMGRLLRPIPDALLGATGVNRSGRALETVAPPYWDRSGGVPAALPVCGFADGVLTLQDLEPLT